MLRALACAAPLLLLAGCLNTFEEPSRPHFVRIDDVDVQPARVLAQSLVLNVSVMLDNRGGAESGLLRLVAKAYSEETGFLIEENATDVGVMPGDTSRAYRIDLTVPRSGGVSIEVTLFEDELTLAKGGLVARNLGALEPDIVDTGLRVSDVDFQVRGVDNSTGRARATIQTDLYLTNEGGTPSEDLQVQVKAREVTTRLIADNQWLTTGAIQPGATAVRSINLSVPDGYNYDFEILTWRGDAVVARNQGLVQLAPTYVKPTNTEVVTTDPNIDDFVRSPTYATPGAAGDYAAPTPKVPGPGLAALAMAVAFAAILVRRSRR